VGFGGGAAVEGLAQMSGSGFERWWSTGDFRWSMSHGDVLVVLFGAALKCGDGFECGHHVGWFRVVRGGAASL